jgi:hypothetical protein
MNKTIIKLTESDLHRIVEDSVNRVVKDYMQNNFNRYNEELEIYNKELQLFKETGNVSREYLEELLRNQKNMLNMLISCCYK